jgi:hypothetical protein
VVSALERDPALSARIMRLAKAVGDVGVEADTVARAAEVLGPHALVSTALGFSLVRARRRGDVIDHAELWRRALGVACSARALARAAGADEAAAWTAGLLQDIGSLALAEVVRREYAAVAAEAGGDHGRLADLERERLGTDHVQVGALLARAWLLPAALTGALERSHAPPGPGATAAELCATLAGRTLGDVAAAARDPVAAALGLDGGAVAAALARAHAEARAMVPPPDAPPPPAAFPSLATHRPSGGTGRRRPRAPPTPAPAGPRRGRLHRRPRAPRRRLAVASRLVARRGRAGHGHGGPRP